MRTLVITVALLSSCVSCFGQGHFHFAGPLSQFLAEGAAPGAVTGGLPFAVVLSEGGATIAPTTFTLQSEGWEGEATLTLENAQFANGRLTATVRLSNGTPSVLAGVRLDVTGATEEYKAKDDQGNDLLKTRAQAVGIASPLLFGDVAEHDDADPQPLEAGALAFQPETTRVMVSGLLSGLYLAGGISTPIAGGKVLSLDFDPQGRLYMAVLRQKDVYRCDADGQNMVAVASFPQILAHIAIDPANGDILGTSHDIFRFSADGADQGRVPPPGAPTADRVRGFAGVLRFDHDGKLYVADDNTLACYVANRRLWAADRLGAYRFHSPLFFDVDGEGNCWIGEPVEDALYRVGPAGAEGKRLATGPDWHLGGITNPRAVRADAHGNVYLIEHANTQKGLEEVQRISVFDREGRIVRVFGRGDRSPAEEGKLKEGQVAGIANDLAFGPDGRVYIANTNGDPQILVFRPF